MFNQRPHIYIYCSAYWLHQVCFQQLQIDANILFRKQIIAMQQNFQYLQYIDMKFQPHVYVLQLFWKHLDGQDDDLMIKIVSTPPFIISTALLNNRSSLRGMDTNNTSSPDHSNILLKNSTTSSTSSTRLTVLIKSLIENFM